MTQSVSESNINHDAWSLGPQWAAVDWVLTDVDDTLTLHGRLPPQALVALAALREQGIEVIAVTGACAGWCDHIAHAWPVSAVIAENGAIVMQKVAGRLQLHSDRPLAEIREDQARLRAQIERILLDHPEQAPVRLDVDAAEIATIERDAAGRRIVEPRDKAQERALTCACASDECNRLAW